jgi:putative transposase
MVDWPHAPTHRLGSAGAFMVTAGTYGRVGLFNSRERLDLVQTCLFAKAANCGASLQAWAIFPNHYHFIASFEDSRELKTLVRGLHSITAKAVNAADATPGRKVWFQYWESSITFDRSYFARLRYVHENAVRHGIVRVAHRYNWCSASWFERNASAALRKTVLSFRYDTLKIRDDFPVTPDDYSSA